MHRADPSGYALLGVVTDALESNDRLAKRRQPFDNDGFNDREVGVVIVVHEDVAYSRNLIPRDVGLGARRSGSTCLTASPISISRARHAS